MAERNISNNTLKSALLANEPFEYAHLVKFERPFAPKDGEFRTNANRYVFLTDGARDITYDSNTYRAHGLISVGSYGETTQARATNMTLSLQGEFLGTEATVTGTFTTAGVFNATASGYEGEVLDFVELGFREGDLVEVTKGNGTNFSDGDTQKRFVISSFTSNNQSIAFARTGTDSDDSAFLGVELSSTSLKFVLVNQEYKGALMEKGTEATVSARVTNDATIVLTAANSKIEVGALVSGRGIEDETVVVGINGTTLEVNKTQTSILPDTNLVFTNPSFLNREVFIYKAFINPETGSLYGDPLLVFKGIVGGTNVQENANAARVQWNLTSHWGDFQAVTGRLGTDELHRALDANGKPNEKLSIRPEYARDLGFLHAETSLNTIAVYQTTETRYRLKKKKRGGLAGLFGGIKYSQEEYKVQVDNEVDLSVYLTGKYLPVVYGVQRVPGVPIFADTLANDSKQVYVAYTLAEGENHGIYNMYIDGAPLICVDKSDFDVRNSSATNSDSQQLQCYGRMDRGGTLGGQATSGTTTVEDCYDIADEESSIASRREAVEILNDCMEHVYKVVDETNISGLVVDQNAEGLQHEETASISHPFNMHFTFHSGRANQKANNILATKGGSNSFKRQQDYYKSTDSYWGANHRLLDTAYSVMKFTIEADQTTIPEVEYVVKGRVLECHNYDGTYVPDTVNGSSDSHTNFVEGQTVTVEKSSNGSSWSSVGSFRILDKYIFTTARNSSHYRFRLNSVPSLGTDTYVRLKSGSNYWHMLTHDNGVVSTETSIPSQTIGVSSLTTDSNGVLKATLTSGGQTQVSNLFGSDLTSNPTTSTALFQFTGQTSGIFKSLENRTLRATLSGGVLTFLGTKFTINQTLSNINLQAADKVDLSSVLSSPAAGLVTGNTFKNTSTGEEREISSYNTTNEIITLESPFVFPLLSSHKFTLKGRGKDLRSSINPAIQTLDLLTNTRYGKGLDLTNDIDLDSVKNAALLCDTRADVTIPLATAASCVAGDIYELRDENSNHVASGKVKTSTSSESAVVLEEVSGKFVREYQNYINYLVGDLVAYLDGTTMKWYEVTSGGYKDSAPVHTSGTTNGFKYISTAPTLHKTSGSGPSTLSLSIDGRSVEYSLYDSDFVKYWRYLGWEENRQWCVTRHQTNFVFDTSRSIFENINSLLSHYNGILSYSNGKYVLDVETQESAPAEETSYAGTNYDWNVNPEYITDEDFIGGITINDNSQRNTKNTIKASISDPQNNFQSRSVSFFNSDFLKADRNVVKTGNYPVTGITSYYNARIGIEKELIQSRYSKEISFTIGPKGLLLKPGGVIAVTYSPFGFESKLFRIENLNYGANCTTQVKAREYDDSIYAISPQVASKSQQATTAGDLKLAAPGAPTGLTATSTKPGVITLAWTNTSGYKEAVDSTEIWVADTQGSSGEITSHATLHTVVDNAQEYNHATAVAGNKYYWVRHRRITRRTSDNAAVKLVGDFSTAITAGVEGLSKVSSPQLDVDVSSVQVKFNSSGALSPSGSSQDVKLTATLRNITPDSNGVVFTLVDADQTSQTDVQFTNSSTTVTDTSSPYEATIDASSFSNTTTNKFVKAQVTDDDSAEVFTELIPVSVTTDGASGGVGIAAAAVKLEPSSSVITYGANDPDGESPEKTITFTTDLQGNTGDSTSAFSGTPYYEFLVDGSTSGSITTTSTFTLPDSDEPATGETVEVKVKVRDGSTSGTVKATDSVTIFGIKSGSDAITAFLTNAAHVVSANSSGTVSSFTGAGGTFKVFIGTTDKTTSCTFSEVSGQETSGLTSTINSTTGVYEVSALSVDLAQNVFRASIPANISPTGNAVTIDQTYSISKSKQGTAGAGGDDGRTVRLTAADYSIVYDEDGANPDPSSSITLTASAQGFTTAEYQFVIDGSAGSYSTTATSSFSVPSSHFTSPKTMQVNVREQSDTSKTATDSLSIFAVKAGSNAYTVILDNEAHAIPADKDGNNPVLTGSGCTIEVFKGSTELNGITSGTPTTGQFKVTVSSDTDITAGSQTSTGNPVVFADHSSLTAATANIVYSINIENTQTVLKKQTFTRVDKGDTGAAGADAVTVLLTNESTSAQDYSLFGSSFVLYVGTGGEMKLYEGATEQTSGVVYGGSGFTDNGATRSKTQNGLTCTINESTGVYSFAGSAWSSNNEEFTLQATYDSVTYSKVVSINKVNALQKVSLSTDNQVFKFANSSAASATPTSITLTATAFAYSGTIQYKWYKNDVAISSVNSGGFGSTSSITIDDGSFSDGNDVYKVEARNSSISTTKFDEDEMTIIRVADGSDGNDGDNVAQVQIYLRTSSSSTPSSPSGSETYNFTSGAITSTPIASASGNWSETVPSGTGQYLWTCKATARGANGANTDTIATSDWSTPVLQSEAQVPRVAKLITIFNPSTSKTGITEPTDTTTGTPYNFETGAFTIGSGGSSGWQNTPIGFGTTHWQSRVTVVESVYNGAQTVTYHTAYRVGGAIIRDPGDWVINWDDSNNRLQLKIDSTVYSNATYPNSIKNDQITLSGLGGITSSSLPTATTGTGTPTAAANNGSTFYSTDQAKLYIRVGNTWTESANRITNTNQLTNGAGFTTFDGDYGSLSNTPSLFDGNYNNLSNKPTLFDGDYGSLSNTPTIPTNTNQLTNGAGYITGITSGNVTGALGFTPYNSTNPSGFTANGTTMNSSGHFTGSSNVGSSKTLIDASNERILIQD